MEKRINEKLIQVKEVDVTVDGIPFVIYFMEYDNEERVFILYFYATNEDMEKNLVSISTRFRKLLRKSKEPVVELSIGDFKKNVIMRGHSFSGRLCYVGEYDEELGDYKGIIHCKLKFSPDEDDYNYLIDKYYPERTHPSVVAQKEKYGHSEAAIFDWNEFSEMKKRYYATKNRV